MSSDFAALQFERKVSDALRSAKQVLDSSRLSAITSQCQTLEDLFSLAEFAVKSAFATRISILDVLVGLDSEKVALLLEWHKTNAVMLSFPCVESYEFISTQHHEECSTTHTAEPTGFFGWKTTVKRSPR